MSTRRWPALVLIPGLLIAAALVSGEVEDPPPTEAGDPDGQGESTRGAPMPIVADAASENSTWYCASGTGAGNDVVTRQVVVIANTTGEPRQGSLTVFTGEGETIEESVEVGPNARVPVNTSELTEARVAATLVELDGGGTAVEQLVDGPNGRDTSECATSASGVWHVASGTTNRDAAMFLAIFNPFPDEAIVDITFQTDDGLRNPEAFQGFVVPGSSVSLVDVGAEVTRRDEVSATVEARTGRVVVDRIQAYGGQDGPRGLAVSLAEPLPAETWYFPTAITGNGVSQQIVVYNPNDEPAEVDIEVTLDDPETNGGVEAFEFQVPRRGYVALSSDSEEWGQRPVLDGIPHSLVVRSLNGVTVVAERTLIAQDPAERPGVTTTSGIPLLGTELVLPAGDLQNADRRRLTLQNPSTEEPLVVRLFGLVDGERLDLGEVEVAPGERSTVGLGSLTDRRGFVLVLEGDRPFVADVQQQFEDPDARALARAMPVDATTSVPVSFGDS